MEIDSTSVYFKEISKEEMDKELPIEVTIAWVTKRGQVRMDCSKGTELGGNQFIGFPAKLPLSNGTTKRAAKEKITKLPQKRRSNRIDSRHRVSWWKNTRNHCAI